MTFRITAAESGRARLVSTARLQATDFRAIAAALGQVPIRARKTGYVAAREAKQRQSVETRWNGMETINTAQPGDWIVTNLSPQQEPLRDRDGSLNIYVIAARAFPDLYERTDGSNEHGAIYRPKGFVEALHLPGGFDIVAPWGGRQHAPAGYLLLHGEEVYGSHGEAFTATYETLSSSS